MSENATWPLPRFRYRAKLDDGGVASFEEVSGLDADVQKIDYRHGNSKIFYPIKMPGIETYGNVTLKRGLVAADSSFKTWLDAAAAGQLTRREVRLELIDEHDTPRQSWTLKGAMPTKVLFAGAPGTEEIAIETLEIGHEGLDLDP